MNAADYSLIDNAFAFQGTINSGLPLAQVATPLAAVAGGSASVPEPTGLALLALATGSLLTRRRRGVK